MKSDNPFKAFNISRIYYHVLPKKASTIFAFFRFYAIIVKKTEVIA